MKKLIFIYYTFLTLSGNASCINLIKAYPHYLSSCKNNTLIWRDGTKMIYDDKKRKSFNQVLNHPDLQDMFKYRYPRGKKGYNKRAKKNFDPGRIRYEPLFKKMYGKSASEVKKNLVSIPWLKNTLKREYYIKVTRINGVNRALTAVSKELDTLLRKKPQYKKYLIPIGGTFKWRKIAGTNRLSVHSFGAAIDINVKHSSYWRWNKKFKNEIPLKIVEIFEKHGFIWGGKWYHFDTMHFEYRPELLLNYHKKIISTQNLF